MASTQTAPPGTAAASRLPGLLLGIGFGGFVGGIVIHQVLQWHHMVSDVESSPMTTTEGFESNTLADGLFHLVAWACVLAGSLLMLAQWQRGRLAPSWSSHLGLLVAGWGLFNLVEGVVDHHVLQLHHVRDDLGGPLAWDLGFLAVSVLVLAAGWALHARGRRAMVRR